MTKLLQGGMGPDHVFAIMPSVPSFLTYSRDYFQFIADHRRLIGFGVLTATLSGFGQTFFIGLFNPNLRQVFDLSHGDIGMLYGGATLASALLLTYIGRWYDRSALWLFLSGSASVLAVGCALMAGAESLLVLFLALLLLRQGGQGLMGHISQMTMASAFISGRGKALSLAAMGFTLAEVAFPPAAVMAIQAVGWRGVWWLSAAAVLFLFLPILLWLLRGRNDGDGEKQMPGTAKPRRNWTVREAITDKRFILIGPAAVAGPFAATVVFFHLASLGADKGWPLDLMALGLSMFAIGHVIGLLAAGPLVDRFSGSGTITPALLPMAGAFIIFAAFDLRWLALVWPALLGLGMGVGQTAVTALLAELYGDEHLGGIRAIVQSLMVVSTAAGPPAIGWVLDLGVGAEAIGFGFVLGILLAAAMAWLAVGRSRKAA
ncbi:MAG: MFS transporter [Anaerolineales bacterium]|nr:MFS transporter [Anaerolineales bacterium]